MKTNSNKIQASYHSGMVFAQSVSQSVSQSLFNKEFRYTGAASKIILKNRKSDYFSFLNYLFLEVINEKVNSFVNFINCVQ